VSEVVGIDLGTTNTVVGSARGGKAEAIPDEAGRTLIPSVVSFHPNGSVLVGRTAKERRVIDPKSTVYSVKRLIGRSWDTEEVRRAPATPVPAAQPVAQPLSPSVAVAATNGVVKLKPEEVAALAFARAAGVHEPHEPKAHPVPVATVEAPPTEVAAAGAAVAAGEPAAAQALNGGNGHSRTVPAPATPAARRAEVPPPPPLPPRRVSAAGRRPSAPPPQREGSGMLAVILTAVIGIIVIGGAIFLVTRGGGGDDQAANTTPKVETTPTPAATIVDAGTLEAATPVVRRMPATLVSRRRSAIFT